MDAAIIFISILYLAIFVVMIASVWRVFTKAGRPGWAAIVPIYNIVVQFQVAKINPWFALLYLLCIIPIVGIIVGLGMAIWLGIATANAFGKGAGFALGLILLPFIFYPILGFGSAKYISDEEC